MKIFGVSPTGTFPPKGGGELRVYNIYSELSKFHDVFLFSQGIRRFELNSLNSLKRQNTINKNFVEYRYIDLLSLLSSFLLLKFGKSSTRIFYGDVLKLKNPKILENKIKEYDIIQVEWPWQFEHIFNINSNAPIVLNGHNVEYDLIKQTEKGCLSKLVDVVKNKERFAVENAEVVFMVSEEDKKRTHKLYGISKSKIHVVPNGTNVNELVFPNDYKDKLKEIKGFKYKKIVIFTGTGILPNVDAVNEIIKMSKKVGKDVLFLVVGSCGNRFKSHKFPNIIFTGFVDDIKEYLSISDIAINPMNLGGGTNTKMLEYMASGLPIITTEVGARGLDVENKKHAIVCNIEEFPYWIETLLNDEDLKIKLGKNAKRLVERKYDWKVIGKNINKIYSFFSQEITRFL